MTPTLSVEAVQDSETLVEVCPVTLRLVGAEGGLVSPPPPPLGAYTWNSESCPAGQPVLAVKVSPHVADGVGAEGDRDVLPDAGSNV